MQLNYNKLLNKNICSTLGINLYGINNIFKILERFRYTPKCNNNQNVRLDNRIVSGNNKEFLSIQKVSIILKNDINCGN